MSLCYLCNAYAQLCPLFTNTFAVTFFDYRFTDDRGLHFSSWRGFTLADNKYELALRTGYLYYFTIVGISEDGVETELSPLYKYDPTGRLIMAIDIWLSHILSVTLTNT